jgi:hypothetical protein
MLVTPGIPGWNGRSPGPVEPSPSSKLTLTGATGCPDAANLPSCSSFASTSTGFERPPSNSTWRALNVTASRFLSCWSVHSRQSSSASTKTREPLCRYCAQQRASAPYASTVK